jgi:GTPase SAR1 family protein
LDFRGIFVIKINYKTITKTFYRGSHGIVVVFDVTCRQSFEEVKTLWMEEVKASCDEGSSYKYFPDQLIISFVH